mgnify:CR=1 FL=1
MAVKEDLVPKLMEVLDLLKKLDGVNSVILTYEGLPLKILNIDTSEAEALSAIISEELVRLSKYSHIGKVNYVVINRDGTSLYARIVDPKTMLIVNCDYGLMGLINSIVDQVINDKIVKCANCGFNLTLQSIKCPRCGKSIPLIARVCPFCKVSIDARECPNCGKLVTHEGTLVKKSYAPLALFGGIGAGTFIADLIIAYGLGLLERAASILILPGVISIALIGLGIYFYKTQYRMW